MMHMVFLQLTEGNSLFHLASFINLETKDLHQNLEYAQFFADRGERGKSSLSTRLTILMEKYVKEMHFQNMLPANFARKSVKMHQSVSSSAFKYGHLSY